MAAAMTEGFGEDVKVIGHGDPLKEVVFGVVERGGGRVKAGIGMTGVGLGTDGLQASRLSRLEPGSLAGLHLGSGDFGELGVAGFADEEGDFIVGGRAA